MRRASLTPSGMWNVGRHSPLPATAAERRALPRLVPPRNRYTRSVRQRLAKKTPKKTKAQEKSRTVTSAVAMPQDMAELLRRVAFSRAQKSGRGRVSVSAVLRELVERNRASLEAEAEDL